MRKLKLIFKLIRYSRLDIFFNMKLSARKKSHNIECDYLWWQDRLDTEDCCFCYKPLNSAYVSMIVFFKLTIVSWIFGFNLFPVRKLNVLRDVQCPEASVTLKEEWQEEGVFSPFIVTCCLEYELDRGFRITCILPSPRSAQRVPSSSKYSL